MTPTSPKARRALLGLLLLGVLLRAVPILWGSTYWNDEQFGMHPDEPKIVRIADSFPESLEKYHDYRYPHFLHNSLGALWWPIRKAQGLPPKFQPVPGETSYERALLFCRAVMVLVFGLGAMLFLARFTRKLGLPRATPWVVAASIAQPFIVGVSCLVQTDVPGAYMLLAVFYVLLRVERSKDIGYRHAALLGTLQGLAIATRYVNAVAMVASLIVAIAALRKGTLRPARIGGILAIWTACATAAVIISMPGVLYDWENVWKSLEYERMSKLRAALFDWPHLIEHFTRCMPVWILLPTIAGAVIAQRTTRTVTLPAIFVSMGVYFAMTASSLRADYVTPVMPIAAVLVGIGAETLWRSGGALTRAGTLGYFVLAIGLTAATTVERYRGDTLYQFNAWLNDTVPPGDVGLAPAARARTLSVPLLPAGYSYVSVHESPEWIVLPGRLELQIRNLSADPAFYGPQGFVLDLNKLTLGNLKPADFAFYDRVLTGSEGYAPFTDPAEAVGAVEYEEIKLFVPTRLRLDMTPEQVRVFRRR